MRIFTAIALVLALVSQFLYQLDCYVLFKINETYIANELCINKAKPELHCNGKCFLKKKVKEARDKQDKELQKDKSFSFVNFDNLIEILIPKSFTSPLKHENNYTTRCYTSPCSEIPHPPPNYYS